MMKVIETSRNLKISIFVNFESPGNEEITEVAILLMKGKEVIRGRMLGKNIDESDDELMEKIFTEEMDKEMFNPETLKLGLRNIETSSNELVIQEIFGCIQTFKSVINRIDGSDENEDQYVVYNDNKESLMNSDFFHLLTEYIEENDDALLPTSLKDVYNRTTDIKEIFSNYGYTDIMYVKESSVSNAAFIGIALDFSLGYK
jgi:hypothetical protein